MNVTVSLTWSEGDPAMSVAETDDGFHVVADPRLSEAQVTQACTELGALGDEVCEAWRARVGLSDLRPAR